MFIQDLFNVHSRFIQDLFKIYSMFIQDLFNVHSRFIQCSFKAMFTLYWIDFRSRSEIDPIQCEQCSGKSNRIGPISS